MKLNNKLWFKDGKIVVIDKSYELSDEKKYMIIKMVKNENGGM
jgi:ribosomal protein S17